MDTNNNNKLNRIFIVCLLIIIGFSVVGVGIGISIRHIWASTLIGVGSGFIINAILILVHYQKNK